MWMYTRKGIYTIGNKQTTEIKDDAHKTILSVYPNPTTDLITIDCSNFAFCELYDMKGSQLAKTYESTINLSKFGGGTYLLNIVDKNGNRSNKKVIVF